MNALDVSARDRYEKKLEYGDGAGKLLDPYLMQIGWQNDPSLWPDLTFCNIYQYLINMPGMFSRVDEGKQITGRL